MKSNTLVRTAALLVALCFSVAAFAKPVVKTINITQTAKVGQVTLQAGEYRLSIDGNKVSIQRGKDQVAESEGRWEERSEKSFLMDVRMNQETYNPAKATVVADMLSPPSAPTAASFS